MTSNDPTDKLPETFFEAWGGVMICVLISAALNGCIAIQACSYFSTFRTDPLVLKSAVAIIWLSNMLHFLCKCWLIHSVGILGYGRPLYAVMIPIGFSIAVALEVIVHVIVQGVYIFRMYRFGKNPYILASCCALVMVEAGMGFAWAGWVAASAIMLQVDARNQQIRWMITCFFTISAFVDVFITASLSYQLWRSRIMGLRRTRRLVDKIIQWTIPTGMLSSAVAISIILLWNIQRGSFLWIGFCTFESDCYTAGLLALLNARRTRFNIVDSDHLTISTSGHPARTTNPSASIALDRFYGQDRSRDEVVYKP